ncbi:MAG TPA: hypothetical protein VI685_28540 [Candidatus Angelobacter sp.]
MEADYNPGRDESTSKGTGTIPLCPHKGCAFKCCNFKQMVHILLYPGEIDEARNQGRSLAHLEIVDPDFHGGMRVRCYAKDTSTCDNGHKPLDCISYPFFPQVSLAAPKSSGSPEIKLTKGSGCPIQGHEIPNHERYVRGAWQDLIQRKPEVAIWLSWFDSGSTDDFDPESYDPY